MVYNFNKISTLSFSFYQGSAVVYDGKIHRLGGNNSNSRTKHFSWNGKEWVQESTLPYSFYQGSAVVYDGKIHILGGNGQYKKHYSWDGFEWSEESELPYDFYQGSAVIYNNEIHILGGRDTSVSYERGIKNHYYWDGTEWTSDVIVPENFHRGSAVVYNDEIHILGGYDFPKTHKKLLIDSQSKTWTSCPALPFYFYNGSAVVYNNCIYVLGSKSSEFNKSFCYFDGAEWSDECYLAYDISDGTAVVYNNKIHIVGGGGNSSGLLQRNHLISETPANIIIYGNEPIVDISTNEITKEDIKEGVLTYDKSGKLIKGNRPPYYEYASNHISYAGSWECYLLQDQDVFAFPLGDQSIKLRNPTANPGYAQLVSVKTDQTESVINILTGIPTTLIEYFRIVDVRYIDKWTVVITYTYRTVNSHAADSDYAYYNRSIHLKKDGSLYQYSQVQVSVAWAANYGCIEDTLIVPMLYPQKTSFEGLIMYRGYYNITTGTLYLRYIPYYTAMRNSAAGDQPYIYINTNIAAVLVNQNANGRVCWPYSNNLNYGYNIKIRGGMFFKNASGVASLFLITKYQTDSSYPFNGAVTTFCSDSDNIDKLTLNIPNKYVADVPEVGTVYRYLLVMGLLNDLSTLVILRKEIDYVSENSYTFDGIWLDFWECNISTKELKYIRSIKLISGALGNYMSNIESDWHWKNYQQIDLVFAYLDNNIFYFESSNYRGKVRRYQIDSGTLDLKELESVKTITTPYVPSITIGSHSDPTNNVFIFDT